MALSPESRARLRHEVVGIEEAIWRHHRRTFTLVRVLMVSTMNPRAPMTRWSNPSLGLLGADDGLVLYSSSTAPLQLFYSILNTFSILSILNNLSTFSTF